MSHGIFKELAGTASELAENRAFDQLVAKIGKEGAERSLLHNLQERGITLEEWHAYRSVRSKMHATPLGIKAINREIDELTNISLAFQ